jgi:hypothetical protein
VNSMVPSGVNPVSDSRIWGLYPFHALPLCFNSQFNPWGCTKVVQFFLPCLAS